MLLRAAPAAATTVTAMPSVSAIAASAAPDRARYRLKSRSASRAATGTRAAIFATAWMASGQTRRIPATTPTIPTKRRTSAPVVACAFVLLRPRHTTPPTRRPIARTAERCNGRGAGGRPDKRQHRWDARHRFGPATTPLPLRRRWRAASRRRSTPMADVSASMRYPTPLPTLGATAIQPTNPSRGAEHRRDDAGRRARGSIVRRRCFSVAPTADHHPELRKSPLGDDREARCRDERDEEQDERAHDEREHAREDILAVSRRARCSDAPGVAGRTERVDARVARVDEHRDERGGRERRRRKQHELVAEVTRVLDCADDGPLHSVEVDCRAQLDDRGCGRRCLSSPPRCPRPGSVPDRRRSSGLPKAPSGCWDR